MNKFATIMILLVLLSCFCIFFGVDLATKGMGRIQGPVLPSGAVSSHPVLQQAARGQSVVSTTSADKQAAAAPVAASAGKQPFVELTPATHDQELNYIGNKLGDLLQIAAHHSISLLVSLFSSLVG